MQIITCLFLGGHQELFGRNKNEITLRAVEISSPPVMAEQRSGTICTERTLSFRLLFCHGDGETNISPHERN